jgi:hypothetical protein
MEITKVTLKDLPEIVRIENLGSRPKKRVQKNSIKIESKNYRILF